MPGYHLNGTRDQLRLVATAAQRVDEVVGHQLRPAAHERHLRRADGDPHSARALCEPLVEIVDQLQHGVVERALVGEGRLDVPAHQPPQEAT